MYMKVVCVCVCVCVVCGVCVCVMHTYEYFVCVLCAGCVCVCVSCVYCAYHLSSIKRHSRIVATPLDVLNEIVAALEYYPRLIFE